MEDKGYRTFTFKDLDGNDYQIGDGGKHAELTDEKIAQSIQEQAARRMPHVQVTPQMASVIQARREVVMWFQSRRAIEAELNNRHTKDELKHLQAKFNHFSKMLAEALATCGDYELALSVLPRKEIGLEREYKALIDAIARDDDEKCGDGCRGAFEASPAIVTREHVYKWVYSKKHGQIMPAVRCHCGALNVRPLSGQIARLHSSRVHADRITAGMDPAQARQALQNAGLTAERLIT